MLACTALVGCTNEDVIDNPNENPVLNGEKAYVVVNINSANGMGSRAQDGSFEFGSEHEINTANFYFYSAEGTYITEGIVENVGGTANSDKNEPNIEFKTKTVVVLKDLAQKGTPKYVLAVLNQPAAPFSLTGKTISEVQELILGAVETVDEYGNTMTKVGEKSYYIMTNSTYNSTTAVDQTSFFATTIDANQFLEQPIMSDEDLQKIKPVEIYVERLAAKVELKLDDEANVKTIANVEGTFLELNKIKTVEDNETLAGSDKQYYAQIVGWNLNATNKKTYLMKNVNTDFKNLEDQTAYEQSYKWSDPANFRTFWGHSWNYGDGTQLYPDNFNKAEDNGTNQGENSNAGVTNASKYALDYVKWSELSNIMGASDYCAENTNTKTVLESQNFHAAATEILLAAKIVDDKGNPVELFRYDNVLYDRANYLNRLFAKVNPNIWKITSTTTEGEGDNAETKTDYKQISVEDVLETIVNENDGKVSVTFNVKESSTKWYTKNANNGYDEIADVETVLDSAFKALFDKEKDSEQPAYVLADHYNGGMMYYNIPIEHLRLGDGTPYTNGKINVAEAEYGVVRNHWYQVTINKIENLGSAVHDPNEDIIPTKDENVRYYVAARINVLSWKVVQQGVDL